MAHSTGHSSRLDRGIDTKLAPFGTPNYAKEQLAAEFASAGLSAANGIVLAVVDNSAAYIAGWLKALKSDKKLVVHTAGARQKAVDWSTGHAPTSDSLPMPRGPRGASNSRVNYILQESASGPQRWPSGDRFYLRHLPRLAA